MYSFSTKPENVFEAKHRLILILKTYFNLPDDIIILDVSNDSLYGYIVSGRFYTLNEKQRHTLFSNILNNYQDEKKFISSVILLSLDEKDNIDS